ncbi:MscS Mechanosensitive ion channel [Thermaerobacter marianensis DSM 12885]|uniref:MscS Mechanosensitive ion channel n=1 Tax=Thermaerobacter marianensis (strain ATCC 700841 / DSM 12885 / JCM 10246 / 7p75a) TaxID=644966 RepID=E6SHP4_THEM7|nr:mechanosensitive ion channel family protein [Thermaerobacter marianensis]ADU50741.1 MscS Mechanosensitive ion channel [Thermaerobacter marianensis DSM 12885]
MTAGAQLVVLAAAPFTQWLILGNPVWRWLVALGIALAVLVALKLVRDRVAGRLARLAGRTAGAWDDFLVELLQRRTGFVTLVVLAVWAGAQALVLPEPVAFRIRQITGIVLVLQVALWANHAIGFFLTRVFKARGEDDDEVAAALAAAQLLSRVGLWTVVILVVLRQLGMDITALVAGLGIAGIAVGLALQNVLGDLFASLSIVLDKPFVVGDFIVVDNFAGTVQHVGIKTTRVRALTGEEIVIANADLLKSRIRNMKRMTERRVEFRIGVTYGTPVEKLERIPAMVREIIEAQPQVRFDRGHFKQLGDSALIFEFVYFVTDPDYVLYMDTQQAINLAIYRRFMQEGIEFAFPTQTVHLVEEGPETAPAQGVVEPGRAPGAAAPAMPAGAPSPGVAGTPAPATASPEASSPARHRPDEPAPGEPPARRAAEGDSAR